MSTSATNDTPRSAMIRVTHHTQLVGNAWLTVGGVWRVGCGEWGAWGVRRVRGVVEVCGCVGVW